MATSPRTAAIAGATGLIGSALLPLLLDGPRYSRVFAAGRRAPASTAAKSKLDVITTDFGATLPLMLPPIDDAFCCLGTTIRRAGSQAAFRAVDFDMVLGFANAAKRAGARRFVVVSSLGADQRSRVFYSRVKGEMEAAVAACGFESLVILRPSLLLGARAEARRGERAVIAVFSAISPLMLGPVRKYRPIDASVVALAMLAATSGKKSGVEILESDAIEGLAKAK